MRVRSRIERNRIKEHAAPEAVVAMLREHQLERTRHDREIRWLEELLVTRSREIQNGTWPAKRGDV